MKFGHLNQIIFYFKKPLCYWGNYDFMTIRDSEGTWWALRQIF